MKTNKTANGRYMVKAHGKQYLVRRTQDSLWDVFQVLTDGCAFRVSTELKKSDALRLINDNAYETLPV